MTVRPMFQMNVNKIVFFNFETSRSKSIRTLTINVALLEKFLRSLEHECIKYHLVFQFPIYDSVPCLLFFLYSLSLILLFLRKDFPLTKPLKQNFTETPFTPLLSPPFFSSLVCPPLPSKCRNLQSILCVSLRPVTVFRLSILLLQEGKLRVRDWTFSTQRHRETSPKKWFVKNCFSHFSSLVSRPKDLQPPPKHPQYFYRIMFTLQVFCHSQCDRVSLFVQRNRQKNSLRFKLFV